jgi:hypothetical protein
MHIPPSQSLWECGRMQGGESQTFSTEKQIKNYSPTRVLNFWDKGAINKHGSNWAFNISLESSWNLDIEMGLYFPFGIMSQELWPKEWLGIKLTI